MSSFLQEDFLDAFSNPLTAMVTLVFRSPPGAPTGLSAGVIADNGSFSDRNMRHDAGLPAGAESMSIRINAAPRFEGNWRTIEGSKIGKLTQLPRFQELVECLEKESERARFELAIQEFTRMTV